MCGITVDGRTRGQNQWKSGGEVLTANYGSRAISDNDANQPCLLFSPKYSRANKQTLTRPYSFIVIRAQTFCRVRYRNTVAQSLCILINVR